MGTADRTFEIARRGDSVEVTGVPVDEVRQALDHWFQLRGAEHAAAGGLRDALVVQWARPVLSEERITAAQRVAGHRSALLETPVFTYQTLAHTRGQQESSVRSWALRNGRQVLTVKHDARIYLPAFQFDDAGALRPEIAEVNAILNRDDTMSEWSRWSWWHAATSFLSGGSPIDVVEDEPARVRSAAVRSTEPNPA